MDPAVNQNRPEIGFSFYTWKNKITYHQCAVKKDELKTWAFGTE